MIKVIKSGISAEAAADMDAQVKATVETTLKDIETRGDAAVRELSEKFDNWSPESFQLSDDEIAACVAAFPSRRLTTYVTTNLLRTGCSSPLDPLQGQIEMRMGRMRVIAKRIDDPHLHPFEDGKRFLRKIVQVG